MSDTGPTERRRKQNRDAQRTYSRSTKSYPAQDQSLLTRFFCIGKSVLRRIEELEKQRLPNVCDASPASSLTPMTMASSAIVPQTDSSHIIHSPLRNASGCHTPLLNAVHEPASQSTALSELFGNEYLSFTGSRVGGSLREGQGIVLGGDFYEDPAEDTLSRRSSTNSERRKHSVSFAPLQPPSLEGREA